MNNRISVVIICRDEVHIIGKTINAVQQITDDVVVVDSGSTDGTQEIVKSTGARMFKTEWNGYGSNKNKGVALAKYDWILSIDADEVIDSELISQLRTIQINKISVVYNIRFRAFLGDKMIRFGEWSNDQHIRLYNRTYSSWNIAAVHEGLILPKETTVITLKGFIHHFTSQNLEEFTNKTKQYALLNAEKYYQQGKKAPWLKCFVATGFSFIKNYFFRLGFLDGKAGFLIAKMNAWYTWLKYNRLRELRKSLKFKASN